MTTETDDPKFTCVFDYDGKKGPNAFLIDTPFGRPQVTALGDLAEKLMDAEEEINRLRDALWQIADGWKDNPKEYARQVLETEVPA